MMERAIKFIPEIVGPFKSLSVLTFLLTIILAAQGAIHFVSQDNTTVWQGSCSFKKWDEKGDIGLVVDCGEHGEGTLERDSFIRSYLNNPGPLMCVLSATNNINCESRPPIEGNDD